MLSEWFYDLYINDYKYLFNYQLDCYIFYDNIENIIKMIEFHNDNFCEIFIPEDIDDCYSTFGYTIGIGIKDIKYIKDWLVANKENVEKVIFNYMYKSLYGKIYYDKIEFSKDYYFYAEYMGYDNLLFLFCNKTHNIYWDFGWTSHFEQKYNDLGFPLIMHYFQITEWSKEMIGDWDNNLEECINNPNFLKNNLLDY